MQEYQSELLYSMAKTMQSRARRVVARYLTGSLFLGALIGVGVWLVGPRLLSAMFGQAAWIKQFSWWVTAPTIALFFAMEGYWRGRSVSSHLRLEAQRTLCQVKTEEHLAKIVVLLEQSLPVSSESSESNS